MSLIFLQAPVLRSGRKMSEPTAKKSKQNKTKTIRQNSISINPPTRECVVRIIRLNEAEMEQLMNRSEKPKAPVYNLRQNRSMNTVQKLPVLKKKRLDGTVAVRSNQQGNAASMWKKLLKKTNVNETFKPNDIIVCKQNKFRPWPATVISAEKKSVLWVKFMGVHSFGSVEKKQSVKFEAASEVLLEFLKNPIQDFAKSIREAEVSFNIPFEKSLTNYENLYK